MEVLISMSVLGLILASSYVLVNRSTAANRSAGERGQATKLANQQIELLKIYANTSSATLVGSGGAFCLTIAESGANVGVISDHQFTGVTPDTDPNEDPEFDDVVYPVECLDYDGLFNFYIQRGGGSLPGTPNTYTAYVRWEAPNGQQINQVTIVQNIYPGSGDLGGL